MVTATDAQGENSIWVGDLELKPQDLQSLIAFAPMQGQGESMQISSSDFFLTANGFQLPTFLLWPQVNNLGDRESRM